MRALKTVLRVVAGVIAGLAMAPAVAGLSPAVSVNQDGSIDTAYRRGDKPAGSPGCLSGWTCPSDPACAYTSPGANALTITAIKASNVTVFPCYAYKQIMSSSDLHLELQITTQTGNQGTFATGGVGIAEALTVADFRTYNHYVIGSGNAEFKQVDDSANLPGSQLVPLTLPEYVSIEYDDAATDVLRAATGNDGTTWTQTGTDVTKTLTFPLYIILMATSYSASSSTTWAFTNIDNSTTLETLGAPVDPDPLVSDTADYVDLVNGVTLSQATDTISDNTDFGATNLACGTTYTVTAGTYSGSKTLNDSCTAGAPMILKCATLQACDPTGSWTITGAYQYVIGFDFDAASGVATQVNFGGSNNKLLGNKFSGWGPTSTAYGSSGHAIVVTGGSHNEIAYNEFTAPRAWPASACPHTNQYLNIAIRSGESSSGSTFPRDLWIRDNYFHDLPDKPCDGYSSGQSDAMEVCTTNNRPFTATIDTGVYIERNLIRRHLQGSGGAIIDIKCPGGVVLRGNTITESAGQLSLRGGTAVGSTVESNYGVDSGGIWLHGDNHRIIGNVLGSKTIYLMAGNDACNTYNTTASNHSAVCDALIAGNSSGLKIGHTFGSQTIATTGTVVEEHTGTVTCDVETGTDGACGDAANPTTTVNYTLATPISSTQVGPGAMSSASASWKTPRGVN